MGNAMPGHSMSPHILVVVGHMAALSPAADTPPQFRHHKENAPQIRDRHTTLAPLWGKLCHVSVATHILVVGHDDDPLCSSSTSRCLVCLHKENNPLMRDSCATVALVMGHVMPGLSASPRIAGCGAHGIPLCCSRPTTSM